MKRYLIDTNILILYLRRDTRFAAIDTLYNPLSEAAASIISVVTEGELRSMALQRHWAIPKMILLEALVKKFLIADIHVKDIIDAYAEIDAFSQGKLLTRPVSFAAKNMGKNDLWIAATASVLKIPLLTTDKDFDHLNGIYLEVIYVDLNKLDQHSSGS
jgi:tRNA(fMet)-specific endonuclease VapC